jgi:hypothetical protein
MKSVSFLTVFVLFLFSCNTKTSNPALPYKSLPIAGTWRLLNGTIIENGDTTVTDYSKGRSFIKIINDSHFLSHDLNKGRDTSANYDSGGGSYTLKDSLYTEHLEYCQERQWEGNDFTFTIAISNDTLIQRGLEKVAGTGINRLNIEKYIRVKN